MGYKSTLSCSSLDSFTRTGSNSLCFPGCTKTPKHLLLPMTVKSLTGNAELVTLLNGFGHGLSYSQIEELETAIAEQQITNLRNGVLLPTACSPSVSAVFCWDNNDLQEETLSGI